MKAERQAKILDLIVKKEIGTQEELTMELWQHKPRFPEIFER